MVYAACSTDKCSLSSVGCGHSSEGGTTSCERGKGKGKRDKREKGTQKGKRGKKGKGDIVSKKGKGDIVIIDSCR
jgi:hypothetical protein